MLGSISGELEGPAAPGEFRQFLKLGKNPLFRRLHIWGKMDILNKPSKYQRTYNEVNNQRPQTKQFEK